MSAALADPLGGRSALQLLDLCSEATESPLHSTPAAAETDTNV